MINVVVEMNFIIAYKIIKLYSQKSVNRLL